MGVLVGYAIGTRGYRVWDPESDRVIETKHVKIDETSIYRNFGNPQNTEHCQDPIGDNTLAWPRHVSDSSDDDSSDTEYSPPSESDLSDEEPFVDIDSSPEEVASPTPSPACIPQGSPTRPTRMEALPNAEVSSQVTPSTSILPRSILRQPVSGSPWATDPPQMGVSSAEDISDTESLPTPAQSLDLDALTEFKWRIVSSIYRNWRHEEHVRKRNPDEPKRINVYYYPTASRRLRSKGDVEDYCAEVGILLIYVLI
uniref:Retroviral polymerase SH3-like domain-containing protein n=1 Tax=Strigamia maritima TaxID=126957 RepID=T1IM03_STRMM